jgi:hypothetical protein
MVPKPRHTLKTCNNATASWAQDLERFKVLGKSVPPGSANTRLIAGKWRSIPRPVEGDAVYTDYYGACGARMDDYYGREYHIQPAQFSKSRLVGDSDYQKVQASMPGIQALRSRPGLTMETAILHGPQSRLQDLTPAAAKTARGVHQLQESARIRPVSERKLREAWRD